MANSILELGREYPDGTCEVIARVHRAKVDGPIEQIEFPDPAPKEANENIRGA